MTIIKREKRTQNYTIVDNTILNNPILSWAAKGLLIRLLSLPDDWKVYVNVLVKESTDGRDKVLSLMKELKQAGYVDHVRTRNDNGSFTKGEYIVYETPINTHKISICEPQPEKPFVGLQPQPEKPFVDDSPQTALPVVALPEVGLPVPAKPTLLSINSNKQLNNQILTAATSHAHEIKPTQQHSAAAVVFTKQKITTAAATPHDAVIDIALTEYQKHAIAQQAATLAKFCNADVAILQEEIAYTILDSSSFSKCNKDFNRKLNAISSVIKSGTWLRPTALVVSSQQQQTKISQHTQDESYDLVTQITGLKNLLASDSVKNDIYLRDTLTRQLTENCEKLAVLQSVNQYKL